MLRLSLTASLLGLLLGLLGLRCSATSVEVLLPDDANFRKYSFSNFTISGVSQIDSVNSALMPDKFDVDKTVSPNRVVFKADLPTGSHSVRVTAGTAKYELSINVSLLPPSVVDQAVFINGPKGILTSLVNNLKSQIRLVSMMQRSTSMEVSVLVRNRTAPDDYLDLWRAYEIVKNATAGTGVQVMSDNPCLAVPGQLCRSRLQFTTSIPSVHQAELLLNTNENFLGFGLHWVAQTVEQMNSEPCTSNTCLNGGVCVPNYAGAGFRCNCPAWNNIMWGPRCEYPLRGYRNNDTNQAYTSHWIGGLPHASDSLQITFETAGTVPKNDSKFFVLWSSTSRWQNLLTFALDFKILAFRVTGALLGGKSLYISSNNGINDYSWSSVSILIRPTKTLVAVCPKQAKDCTNFSVDSGSTITDFSNFWLDIGNSLSGCVQAVTVNGYFVDMLAANTFVSGAGAVRSFCEEQSSTCSGPGDNNYVCGGQSVCYGFVYDKLGAPTRCHCKCIGSKRKERELVTSSQLCQTQNPSSIAWNLCTKDPLIITTTSNEVSTWKVNSVDSLTLQDRNAFSMEMELRTLVEGTVTGILRAIVNDVTRRQLFTQSLDMTNGSLRLCIDTAPCLAFPPITANDGEWHSVHASTQANLLKLTIDEVSLLHDWNRVMDNAVSLDLTSRIPNSWLRNIRVSGTYMSTTVNETDQAADYPSTKAIIPFLAAGATVSTDGVDLAPSCSCPDRNTCSKQWGRYICQCPAGQELDASNNCVGVNPCVKFKIACPISGSCQQTGGDPGFQCVCPQGVTSRMCVIAGGESTPGPTMAALQWWIWLIIAVAIALVLFFLIALLFLRCRSSPAKMASAAGGQDIEKIHEGMGDDNENDGVPPEDYNGPLNLFFALQKDNSEGLPNFQPVLAASERSAQPGESQRPAGASAPDGAPELSDPATYDETLNYGYEDTRDDDAGDLDQISLVSADTDSSLDLKSLVDALGPKFQPLSDILT